MKQTNIIDRMDCVKKRANDKRKKNEKAVKFDGMHTNIEPSNDSITLIY